ncbi:unnamed protein product [Hydatigera taeniaeformis]|uniref:TRAF-type domain-containing protein n=1 Tax=Hydatigena taeniaeformis TaxID=6205 RepID=A0A0R3WU45_HYDTA|nr:unnamed protein product [Hydatigera taeniaeformis]
MLSLHESVYLERAIEQSESNLQEILQRLNELSLDLLSSSAEQSEEEGLNQTPSFTSAPPSSSRTCPIHQAGSKAVETCCNHCEMVIPVLNLSSYPCVPTCNAVMHLIRFDHVLCKVLHVKLTNKSNATHKYVAFNISDNLIIKSRMLNKISARLG